MHIVTISDTHNKHEYLEIPDGDVIIHSGDFSNRGSRDEIDNFLDWYRALPHKIKILVAGNHDKGTDPDIDEELSTYFENLCGHFGVILLNDSETIIKCEDMSEIKIWGSPVSPTFGHGWAWNRDRDYQIDDSWKKIPKDVDIVVTHGPPYGYTDRVMRPNIDPDGSYLYNVGCKKLLKKLDETSCSMVVSGHIHEARGVEVDLYNKVTYVNASCVNINHDIHGKVFRFDWGKVKKGLSRGQDYER